MASFRFRLERLFQWQQAQRELQEARLKQAFAALDLANSEVAQLKAARVAADLEVLGADELEGRDLAALSEYRLRLAREEQLLLRKLEHCQKHLHEQRARWIEIERRCRLLEKLKMRRLAEFEYDADRALENLAAESHLALRRTRRAET